MVRNRLCLVHAVLLLTNNPAWTQDQWLMKGHDVRRTGQSKTNGPLEVTNIWVAEAPAAFVINIGATVTEEAAFFGSWGLLRTDPLGRDARFWDKFDGKMYGLDIASGESLWGGPLDLDVTNRCYEFEGRERSAQDLVFCGFSPYHVTFYNGTVEGQAAVDPERGVLYLGRGDGKLYAIDPDAGQINWRFQTFNPELPNDPDGGGEIISSPVLGPDGTVYCASWGLGPYETNAFYALNPNGEMLWRFPTDSSLTGEPLFVSPAISPDNTSIYFGGFFDGEPDRPARLFALNLNGAPNVPDDQRLKWALELRNAGNPVWTTTLAIGSEGTIYVGGFFIDGTVNRPVVFAIQDGSPPQFKWSTPYVQLNDGAQWVGGIALREVAGETVRLYVATTNFRSSNNKEEGSLYALDPASGSILAAYDPSDDEPTAVGGLNSPAIGADGIIYFGVRGKFAQPLVEPVNGHLFAIAFDESRASFQRVWNFEVDGHLEWNHPAIGPEGGIYFGSSVGAATDLTTYDTDSIPPNTTCKFYALKGTSNPVVVAQPGAGPATFRLGLNYPNPFNPETTITYELAEPGRVILAIYNILGQRVDTLVDDWQPVGSYEVTWDGRNETTGRHATSGVYFYQLQQGDLSIQRKMALIR